MKTVTHDMIDSIWRKEKWERLNDLLEENLEFDSEALSKAWYGVDTIVKNCEKDDDELLDLKARFLKTFLDQSGSDFLNERSNYLYSAVGDGAIPIVRVLLEAGVDPNVYGTRSSVGHEYKDYPILALPVKEKIDKAAKLLPMLLEAGANINVNSGYERDTLLHRVIDENGHYNEYDSVFSMIGNQSYFLFTSILNKWRDEREIDNRYINLLKAILDAGADLTARNRQGQDPLARSKGNFSGDGKRMQLIIQEAYNRLSPEEQDKAAGNPKIPNPINGIFAKKFIEIIKEGRTDHIKRFIEAGHDVNVADNIKNTPLFYAAESNNSEGVKIILKNLHKIEPTEAFFKAAMLDADIAEIAISKGFNVKKGYKTMGFDKGWTLLYGAVQASNPDLVRLLLRNGADPMAEAKCSIQVGGVGYADLETNYYTGKISVIENLWGYADVETVKVFIEEAGSRIVNKMKGIIASAHVLPKYSVMEYLIAQGWSFGTAHLSRAIANRAVNTIDLLIKSGVSLNPPKGGLFSEEIVPPLFQALVGGEYDLIKLLLRNGSDPNLSFKGVTLPSRSEELGDLDLYDTENSMVTQIRFNGETFRSEVSSILKKVEAKALKDGIELEDSKDYQSLKEISKLMKQPK